MVTNKQYTENSLTREPDKSYTNVRNRIESAPTQMRLIHGALGIAGEAGELVDAIKKSVFYGKELDKANIKEELGDILWYMTILLDEVGSSFEEIMQMNDEKLEKRYAKGFSEKAAVERVDKFYLAHAKTESGDYYHIPFEGKPSIEQVVQAIMDIEGDTGMDKDWYMETTSVTITEVG